MSPVLESIAWGLIDFSDPDFDTASLPAPTLDQLGDAYIGALQAGSDEWAYLIANEIDEMIRRAQHVMATQLLEANAGVTRIH